MYVYVYVYFTRCMCCIIFPVRKKQLREQHILSCNDCFISEFNLSVLCNCLNKYIETKDNSERIMIKKKRRFNSRRNEEREFLFFFKSNFIYSKPFYLIPMINNDNIFSCLINLGEKNLIFHHLFLRLAWFDILHL